MTVTVTVTATDTHADVAMLRRSLAAAGEEVEVRETHCTVVFLVGDRAYKLRKGVRYDFADLSSREARAVLCRREAALNAALAPGLVLGVRGIVPDRLGTSYVLGDAEDPLAVDCVVEMRRFDEESTMRALIREDMITTSQAAAVGARLAAFHRTAERRRDGVDYGALIDRNFEALLPLADACFPGLPWPALQRFAAAFLSGWIDVLDARARAGSVIDGHGDLRADHVVFDGREVQVVDRLEYDDQRVLDIADELGFLLMELKDLSRADALGDAVLAGYEHAGGTRQSGDLLAFFGAYRAQVRAKVALLRAAQPGADADAARQEALRLLHLSQRLGWRARGPLLLLMTGPPASGKSTLARVLGEASGLPVLSSDAIRREQPGTRPDYAAEGRAAVYVELARRAGRERAAIIDATFGDEDLHRAFQEQLTAQGGTSPLVVECRAPTDVRLGRAVARALQVSPDSDAGPDVALDLGARFTPLPLVHKGAHLVVDTRASLAIQVDEVTAWLDARLAAGRGAR
jgi:aminoglycoside phosphotransferase family enzyme/predicted kinase